MYEYGYSSASSAVSVFVIIFYVIMLAVCIFMIAANWKLFTKAGVEGWKAIIPYYNTYVMCQIAGTNIIWFILSFVPCVNILASVWITMDFLKSYEASTGMCILGIFFPYIVVPVVAFSSKYQYIGVGE